MSGNVQDRLALKTPEASFLRVLEDEFDFSPRVSQEVLATAQEMLVGGLPAAALRPGQIRQVVARLDAPFGPPPEPWADSTVCASRPPDLGRRS